MDYFAHSINLGFPFGALSHKNLTEHVAVSP